MAPATLKAIQSIKEELGKFCASPPSKVELDVAQESAINSYVFGFVKPSDIVNAWASNEFYGFTTDYLLQYTKNLAKVTPADIFRVSATYYQWDAMKVIVVGNKKKIATGLNSLGTVVVIPLDKLD
jgi:zinc protease